MQVTVRCPRCDRSANVEYPEPVEGRSRPEPPVFRCSKCKGTGVIVQFGMAPPSNSAAHRSDTKKMAIRSRSERESKSGTMFRHLGGGAYVGLVPNRPSARRSEKPKANSTTRSGTGDALSRSPSSDRICSKCGSWIPKERLAAVVGTRLCVHCASTDPSGQRNRREEETFGSRADWIRDRASWKRRR